MTTLGTLLGNDYEEDFSSFDITEIQNVLFSLKSTNVIDIAHAEALQQQSLRAADILSEYIGKLIKTTSYLESKVSSTKNKASLEFKPETGKATADQRRQAGEASPEVEEWANKLARAKGGKAILERKYDILIKAHHQYKELAFGMRKGIVSYTTENKSLPGYE